MPVFFSGTDMTEILDNSVFHNFYFSLIVNNVNNMMAKVAYRMHKKSGTKNEYTHNDINGVAVTTTDYTETSDETVMIYDCDILKPYTPDAATRSRFCQIRDIKSAANAERQSKILAEPAGRTATIGSIAPEKKTVTSKDYLQGKNMAKEYARLTSQYTATKSNNHAVPGNLFDVTTPEGKIPTTTLNASSIRYWMIDLLGQGNRNQDLLSKILQDFSSKGNTRATNFYLNTAFERLELTYQLYFGDAGLGHLKTKINETCKMLYTNYGHAYEPLIQKICKKLKSSIHGRD